MPSSIIEPTSPQNLDIPYFLTKTLLIDYREQIYNAIEYNSNGDANQFMNAKTNLNNILVKASELNNLLDDNTIILDNSLEEIDIKINNLMSKRTNINTEFDLLIKGRGSSKQLIEDFQKTYNLQYTTNWSIAIGIIIIIYLGYYLFRTNSSPQPLAK